jgi:hypothetical protein
MLQVNSFFKIILLDICHLLGYLNITVFWKLCPLVWSGEYEACAVGRRLEELLNLIQKYMTVLKK